MVTRQDSAVKRRAPRGQSGASRTPGENLPDTASHELSVGRAHAPEDGTP